MLNDILLVISPDPFKHKLFKNLGNSKAFDLVLT